MPKSPKKKEAERVVPTSFKFRPEWLAEMKEASVKLGFVSFTDFVVASMNDAVERKLKAKARAGKG